MIFNTSYNDPKIKRLLDEAVGKKYGFFNSLRLGGTGSQRLIVKQCSHEIEKLFRLDNYPNHCNIELRPAGIIVHFRSRLEMYVWVIPFKALCIESRENCWYIQRGSDYMTVGGANNKPLDSKFLKRLQTLASGIFDDTV